MPHVVTEPCIDVKCLDCMAVCPVEGIFEVERMVVVDRELCFDCGACRAECSVGAIFLDRHLPDQWTAFTDINAAATERLTEVDDLVETYCHEHALAPIPGRRRGVNER